MQAGESLWVSGGLKLAHRFLSLRRQHVAGEVRYLSTMPRKTYTERFKRDAVSLYESTPGATINAMASDLGVNRNSLRSWLDAFGTRTKTNANGEKVASLIAASDSTTAASGLSDAERIRVLERENAKLREEREILRKAAK